MLCRLQKTALVWTVALAATPWGTFRAAPVNGGTASVSANYHPGGANTQEYERIASTHDLIVLGTGWADEGPPSTYYQVNPAIMSLVYQSWFDIGPSSSDYDFVNQNEDWFYHDASGNRIAVYSTHENADCDPQSCRTTGTNCNCRFGMNMGHPEYRAFVATRFADIVTGGGAWGGPRGFDGIFLDNTNPNWPYRPAKVQSGWTSATPVYPGGTTQTEASWVSDQKGFLQVVKSAMGGPKLLIYNGCIASANFPNWKDQSYAYLEHADGCTMEYWTVNGSGTSATVKLGSDWDRDMDLFRGVATRGKWATPLIGSGVHSAAVNRYGIASVLLFRENDKASMNFWKGTGEEAVAGRFAQTFPEAFVDLGIPEEAYVKLSNGVASRRYTRGRVLLNSTSSNQTVSLGESMRDMAGTLVTSVTLAPGTAEILTKEGSPSDPPPGAVSGLERTDRR
jgi:hypothetical protein